MRERDLHALALPKAPGRHAGVGADWSRAQPDEGPFPLLPECVMTHAAARPDALAYLFHRGAGEQVELSFGTLAARAADAARSLVAVGCGPGARVALMFEPGSSFVVGLLGTFLAGCAAVPVARPSGPTMRERVEAILAEADCAVLLTEAGTVREGLPFGGRVVRIGDPPAAALPERETEPGSVAIIQYTSGSTGTPRGVLVTHGALAAQLRAINRAVRSEGDERAVTWLPPEHDMGLVGGLLFNLWQGGATCVLPPASFIRRPLLWLDAISRWRGTISVAPNFAYDLCVQAVPPDRRASLDLSCWRVALNGAEPVRPETMERFAEAFAPAGFDARAFLPCYGLAEATLLVSGAPRGAGAATAWFDADALDRGEVVPSGVGTGRCLASSGPVRTTGGVRIVAPATGAARPPDRTGEIWIAGDSLGSGYHGRPEDSRATFGAVMADGSGPYLRSGDTGFLWRGELFLTGRIKDTVLWHGRTLHAADLELLLDGTAPTVRSGRIAVHQGSGREVDLVAEVARGGLGADGGAELAGLLWRRLLAEAGVDAARVLLARPGTLLWTSSGKLRRRASHERLAAEPDRLLLDWCSHGAGARRTQVEAARALAAAHGADGAPASAFLRFFALWIAAATATDPVEVDPDLSWADQGLDSLSVTELVLDLELATGREVPGALLFDVPHPRALAALLGGPAT